MWDIIVPLLRGISSVNLGWVLEHMSIDGNKGRGRGVPNLFAALFNPPVPSLTPVSPNDTFLEVDPGSQVQTVPAPISTTSAEDYPAVPTFSPRHLAENVSNTNLGFTICTRELKEDFQALQEHQMVVQNCHITDIQTLQDQVAHLTCQAKHLQYQLHYQQPPPP
ncbi:hypothetical protein HOY80DRAFT_1028610 [Tuber brumale]|nr:hypothetical protein HOY80DRAFT_1028610 [Tuber brumale]